MRCPAHSLEYSVAVAAFLCLLPFSAAAQGTLEGTIRHAETGAALSGVQVGVSELSLGGITDASGRYEIADIPAGMHTVHIQRIGYATEVREVTISDGVTTRLNVELAEAVVALEGLVAVGSRARPRTVAQSAVPIDAITGQDFIDQGDTDVNDLLRTVIPSFNINPQATGDAARIIRPASLRGLAPDHTLVLVNGKRRHRAAVITWIGGGFADGAQGPDLSSIPAIALRQVEVLRDGASAQYGSDAIAGVVNLTLKDASSGGSVEVRTGTFWEGDGESYTISGNIGLPLGENGFANLSAEFGESNPTSRSIQRDDAAALIAAGNTHVRDPAQVWGAPTIDNDVKLWGNFGHFLGDGLRLYGHANYASETVTGGFFFRNPNTRAGVFSLDGGETLLVGDVIDATDGVLDGSANCPVVRITNWVPDPVALGRVFDDPNCFTFQEMFPGGFTPQFGGDAVDASVVAGLRGQIGRLLWDVSSSAGRSAVDFFIDKTVNASLGPDSPSSFDPGIYEQSELNLNVDLNYAVSDVVNVAAGAEFRDEHFEIGIGETASWEIGPYAAQGFSAGSNGFPGFSDIAAGGWHRVNFAVYGDLELRSRDDRWTVGTALRTERFEDFGTTANGKLAARYALTEVLAVRGSASTGFRAPTPGQQNAFNVSTQFDRTLRELVNNGTIPSTSRVAELKGGKPLDAEKSVNASLGAVIDAGSLTVSADYFRIALSDRLALSQVFALDEAEAERLIAEGITSARNLANFRFFTNQFDTRTQGIDVVASFVPERMGGGTEFSLAFNHTATTVTSYNPAVLDELRIRQLEDALPGTRWTTSGRRAWDAVSLLGRLSYYAGWFDSRDDRDYPGEFLVDIEATYAVSESAKLTIGGQNALNRYPEENPNAASVAGNRYSPATPFGASGGFVYVKMGFSW